MLSDTVASISILFFGILIAGYWLSAYLYRTNHKKFSGSDLQTKILMWIPIFLVFLAFIYGLNIVKVSIVGFLIFMIIVELAQTKFRKGTKLLSLSYSTVIILGLLVAVYLSKPTEASQNLLIYIGFCTVLSDVTAFFCGNFLGKHHLPKAFNDKKSWEGVAGQIIGAFIGYLLLAQALPDQQLTVWIALPIGIGSALGDLCNSYVKRRVGIKDWSQRLPGHGGYIDRLSSLSFSILSVYLICLLT